MGVIPQLGHRGTSKIAAFKVTMEQLVLIQIEIMASNSSLSLVPSDMTFAFTLLGEGHRARSAVIAKDQ